MSSSCSGGLVGCQPHSHGLGLGIGSAIHAAEAQLGAFVGHLIHLALLGIEWSLVAVLVVILLVELYHREGEGEQT